LEKQVEVVKAAGYRKHNHENKKIHPRVQEKVI